MAFSVVFFSLFRPKFALEGKKTNRERKKKLELPLPPPVSPRLTLTFLFIERSGEGERDGVVGLAGMVSFFFFRAREEESGRQALIALFSLLLFQCPSSLELLFCVQRALHTSLLLLFETTIANRPRASSLCLCLDYSHRAAEEN